MKAKLMIVIAFMMIAASCAPQVPCPAYTTKNNQMIEADRSL